MNFEALLKKTLPQIPNDIAAAIEKKDITLTAFDDKNEILKSERLQSEIGYGFFDKGGALVSMTCPMPGITPDMINWWFWWHPQEDIRYQIWFPGSHHALGYAKTDEEYFKQSSLPDFKDNDQYPDESVGGKRSKLVIRFKTPEEMGFSKDLMKENHIPVIVCGHVGLKGLFTHTEMTHIFKETDDGLFLISRFWMGEPIKAKPMRKKIITDQVARGMAEHCCIEYRNLVEILPDLYHEYR